MTKMKFLYSLILLGLSFSLFSQRSKDGVGTISAANTIVNAYTSLTADANAGSSTINVANSAGFNVGDLVLIVQMQGTKVNAFWEDGVWNDPNNSTSNPAPTNLVYGGILDYYTCGNNEFAEVTSIPNGTSITLDCSLNNSYTYSVNINVTGSWGNHTAYGNVQVIKVPRYSSLTVNAGGSITCPQWNGTTGGVVAIEVENNTVLSNSPSIDVSGKGFRGGIKDNAVSAFGGNKWGAANRDQGGYKGESIAGDTTIYKNYAALIGRGSLANGGGGGNAHNCGGGGGANGGVVASYNGNGNPIAGFNTQWNLEGASFATNTSSGGGRGGYSFSNSNQSVTTKAPGNTSWGGDNRRNFGGFGGRPLDYSTGRIYLGGGGGAGDGNENRAGAGGNGGGIVFLVCYGNLSGAGTIVANGANGLSSSPGCTSNDGAGGGGGGGTILLKVNGTISLTAGTALSAVGGNGGNVNFNCVVTNSDGYGPGGSGGGGYIASTGTLPSNNVTAGTNGIQTGNTSNITNNFPPNGATRGGSGGTGSLNAYTLTASANQSLCVNQAFTVTASSTEPGTSINWYNTNVGGSAIATGTAYAAPGYTAAGTYTLFAGACSGTYRQPIQITVTAGLNITVNSPTICPTQTITLTANGATTYTWNTGPTTNTISVSPSSTTIYTINGTAGLCTGTQTTAVTVSSTPTISVANAAICSGSSTTLTASGASSYTWAPGGQTTTSVVVTPTTNTTYTITGSNGACTNTTTASVNITSTPTLVANSTTICPGQVATFTVSGATTYTWNPGSISGTTYTTSPAASTTVSVIGANGTCTAQITRSVTVSPSPTIAVSNQTICPTQTATLTASGATTYTWNTGPTTNTLSVSPASQTVYTVTGTLGSCASVKTATVFIAAQPTVSVANATVCSGNSTTLTANGATSYTWATGGQTTSSIVITPSTNTTYTITGSNGTCTNTTTASVSVTATPTLVANSSTICPTQTATLTVSGATTYTWNPGSVTGTSYTMAPASNTVVTVIGANGTCTSSATASITIGTGISITVNSPTICAGQTASLTASGAATYTWNTGPNTSTLNISPTSTTVYTISGTSGSCSGLNTATVNVVGQPTVSVANASICSGNSATLTANGATSYTWASGGQTTSSIVVTPTTSITYTISGSNGVCTTTTTASVNVTSTPTLVANSTTICPAQTATLTVSGATTYTWNPGNVTGTSFTIAPISNTTASVIGANGTCTSSATASITIGTGIPITVNSETICPGQTATLTASGATSYTWDTGSNNSSISVSPTSTTIYTIAGSSSTCPGLNTATVTVASQPTVAVSDASICSGTSATLTASGATNYTWSPGGQTTGSIVDNPNTTTIYTITGTNGTCTNTTTATINTTATPTLVANSVTICAAQTATLLASGATDYTWTPGNVIGATYTIAPASNTVVTVVGANGTCTSSATPSITIGTGISIAVNSETICTGQTASLTASGATTYTWDSGANTNTLNVNPTSTTVYTITGSNGSCNGLNTATVTVNNVPTLTVTSGAICSGETATLTASGATTYTWDSGATTNTINVSPTTTTIYTVTGTALNGCTSSTISSVGVSATPTISVNPTSICSGQTATLTATGSATSFTWSTTENTQTINPTPVTTTTYVVTGNNGGCSNSFTTTVTVDNIVLSTYSLAVSTCPTETVALFGTGTNSATTTYTWSNGINTYSQTVSPVNTTTYVVNGTSLSGCPALSGTVIVNVSSISASFNGLNSTIMSVGETLNLTNTSTGASSILWDYCNGISTNSVITIPLADTGSCCIKLVATNATCKDSVTKCVTIITDAVVVIPNVFTPNGDTKNDLFKISSTGLKSLNCVIYDRWGLKMYEWDGINGFWDGNSKTGTAPDGTYFYIINYTDLRDKSVTEKGYLNLFK